MSNRIEYEQNLLHCASDLEDLVKSGGLINQYVLDIIQDGDEKSAAKLCVIIGKIAEQGNSQSILKAKALKDALVMLLGYRQLSIITKSKSIDNEEEKTFDQLVKELNSLVGLESVKKQVNDLIAYQKVQLLRKSEGLSIPQRTLHLAFTGKPGTGKTTVARIVGRIYKQIGLLSKGHFVEVSRTDLIAGYQGQTALKVKSVIDKAKGGVLFIDEAYSITENDHSDSYGRECLTELTKALEDYRKDLVVIVAGYTEPMNKFFESNPGLKSRFNTFIEFEDYTGDELLKILMLMCKYDDYELTPAAIDCIQIIIEEDVINKGENFANGRYVRNLYEKIIMNQARRISLMTTPTKQMLTYLTEEDVQSLK